MPTTAELIEALDLARISDHDRAARIEIELDRRVSTLDNAADELSLLWG